MATYGPADYGSMVADKAAAIGELNIAKEVPLIDRLSGIEGTLVRAHQTLDALQGHPSPAQGTDQQRPQEGVFTLVNRIGQLAASLEERARDLHRRVGML
jgi:hypothetical protein